MEVVVLGAGGRTGRLVVEEALRAGHRVTAAVRTPPEDPVAGARVVRADIRDAASLAAAVEGHDVVVSAVGPPGRKAHALYSDGARATVAAMRDTGVARYVGISSVGVRHDDPHFAWWYRGLVRPIAADLYADMRRMEEIVRDSGLEWTFVRPTYLSDSAATGAYRVADGAVPEHGWRVSRADLARFIVEELALRRWSCRAPSLAD